MDRQAYEPGGEAQNTTEQGPLDRGRGDVVSHMALTALGAGRDVVMSGQDYFPRPTWHRLTADDIAAMPDGWVVEVEEDLVPGPETRRRYYQTDPPEEVRIAPVLRTLAERRAEMWANHEGQWGDAHAIAGATGLPLNIVHAFIERNRSKLGTVFVGSELRRRVVSDRETSNMTEHFSSQFVTWAIASLLASLARHNEQQPNPES